MWISFLNQKRWGLGKSSSVFHSWPAAYSTRRAKPRVLLIDNDPQASLTQGFHGPAATEADRSRRQHCRSLRTRRSPVVESVIIPTGLPGVDLVPGSIALTLTQHAGPGRLRPDRQDGIRSFLEDAGGDYDLVLIDNPPNLHLCSLGRPGGVRLDRRPPPGRGLRQPGAGPPVQRSINAVRRVAQSGAPSWPAIC